MSNENEEVKLPEPVPLKGYLKDEGRTHIWLSDRLAVILGKKINPSYRSDVLNGRTPAPPEWVLPVAEILGVNVDEARELLGLTGVHAGV